MKCRIRNNIQIAIRTGKIKIFAIPCPTTFFPPSLMQIIKVNNMLIQIHILRTFFNNISNKLLNCIHHILFSVRAISYIIMQENLILVIITNQRINESRGSIQEMRWNTFFRSGVDSTNSTLVLFNLGCFQSIDNTIFNQRPLDRIRAFFIEVTNIHSFQLLHWSKLHFDHCIINMPHFVFKLHAAFPNFTFLPSLRYFIKESIEN